MSDLATELIRCPLCKRERETAKTLGLPGSREVICPTCLAPSTLEQWRVLSDMPVEVVPEIIDEPIRVTTLQEKLTSEVSPTIVDTVLGVVAMLVGIAFSVLAAGFWFAAIMHTLDLRSPLMRTRFKADNAYGATANSLEDLQFQVLFFKYLVCAILLTVAARWTFDKFKKLSESKAN